MAPDRGWCSGMRLPRTADVGAWPVAPSSLLGLFSSTAGRGRRGRQSLGRTQLGGGVRLAGPAGGHSLQQPTELSRQGHAEPRPRHRWGKEKPFAGTRNGGFERPLGLTSGPPRLSLGSRAPLKWPCPDHGCRAGAGLGGPRLRPAAATFGAASGLHRYRPSSCFPIFLITNDSSDAVIYQTRPSPDV